MASGLAALPTPHVLLEASYILMEMLIGAGIRGSRGPRCSAAPAHHKRVVLSNVFLRNLLSLVACGMDKSDTLIARAERTFTVMVHRQIDRTGLVRIGRRAQVNLPLDGLRLTRGILIAHAQAAS